MTWKFVFLAGLAAVVEAICVILCLLGASVYTGWLQEFSARGAIAFSFAAGGFALVWLLSVLIMLSKRPAYSRF